VQGEHPTEADALKGNDAVQHLRHHGIDAAKYRATGVEDEIAETFITERRGLDANLLVLGSYGHSRGMNYCRAAPPIPFAIPLAHRALKYGYACCRCVHLRRGIDGRQGDAMNGIIGFTQDSIVKTEAPATW
jgi:hypothetical protein